jgi:hypothetical protein
VLIGGKGRDRLYGGPNNDVLIGLRQGRDRMFCGKGGRDQALVDRHDRLSSCELVERSGADFFF